MSGACFGLCWVISFLWQQPFCCCFSLRLMGRALQIVCRYLTPSYTRHPDLHRHRWNPMCQFDAGESFSILTPSRVFNQVVSTSAGTCSSQMGRGGAPYCQTMQLPQLCTTAWPWTTVVFIPCLSVHFQCHLSILPYSIHTEIIIPSFLPFLWRSFR